MFKNFNPFQSGFRNAQGCQAGGSRVVCKNAPARGCRGKRADPLRGEGVGHLDDEPPADPLAPESFGGLTAGHVGLPRCKGRRLPPCRRCSRPAPRSRPVPCPGCAWCRVPSKNHPAGQAGPGTDFPPPGRKPDLPQRSGCPRGLSAPRSGPAGAAVPPPQGRRWCGHTSFASPQGAGTRPHPE